MSVLAHSCYAPSRWDAFDVAVNLQAMVIYGFTLGYAVGAFDPVRLEWLCTKLRCAILVFGTAVSVPCFSLISDACASGIHND